METTDIGLAAYIYSLGNDVEIDRSDPRHCVFSFGACPEVREWQSGQAMVNVVIFLSAYRALLRKVMRHVGEETVNRN